jgi:hypothetical protein
MYGFEWKPGVFVLGRHQPLGPDRPRRTNDSKEITVNPSAPAAPVETPHETVDELIARVLSQSRPVRSAFSGCTNGSVHKRQTWAPAVCSVVVRWVLIGSVSAARERAASGWALCAGGGTRRRSCLRGCRLPMGRERGRESRLSFWRSSPMLSTARVIRL